MDADDLASRVADAMLAAEGTGPAWGIRIEEARKGYCRLSMELRADMLNGFAICHGGLIATLADSAFAFACNSRNALTVASGFTPAQLLAQTPPPYPPALTGLRGHHAGSFEAATRRINGGLTGYGDRLTWLAKARACIAWPLGEAAPLSPGPARRAASS